LRMRMVTHADDCAHAFVVATRAEYNGFNR
jgi:hypothetical protein